MCAPLALALFLFVGCDGSDPEAMTPVAPTGIAAAYPNLDALFDGDQGMYAGCGPNDGVCHNANRFPNLSSVGAVTEVIGVGCNHLRETRGEVHDWCEVGGDFLRVDDTSLELLAITALPEGGGWTVAVRGDLPEDFDYVAIERLVAGEDGAYVAMYEDLSERLVVENQGSGVVSITLPDVAEGEVDPDLVLLVDAFGHAGLPGDPSSIQLADSNGNGVEGGALGKALIVPGHPEDSYLIRRLTDPSFGTLMPLANCCHWSKESLRALWCWIAGLDPDGSNAREPIDYATCPDGPVESVVYPEPGPECEQSGLCPVMTEQMLNRN